MSFDVDWDIDKYRDEHESDEHWELRRAFMEKWQKDYPEKKLVCLARVFTNIELLGCRYPPEVMQEVAKLSYEVAQPYRNLRKTKLQRTFVSASTAAEDRAKGIKRKAGVVTGDEPKTKIQFIAAGKSNETNDSNNDTTANDSSNDDEVEKVNDSNAKETLELNNEKSKLAVNNNYLNEMLKLDCINVREFKDHMFRTAFGRFVLLIRPWTSMLSNIQSSCQVCNIELNSTYENQCFSLKINGLLVAQATGESKAEARSVVENIAWERLRQEVISVVFKEQFIAQNDARITVDEVSGRQARDAEFGTPVENTVAMKMMQMMGWKGGGLGADAQGIAEPIKPNLQLVNRAGLGSTSSNTHQLRKAAFNLMNRFLESDTFDVDLVFSADFSKEERALLHQCAQRVGLASRSYGDKDRFLVVKKKMDPFSLARAVIEQGGVTPKYQVFIPVELNLRNCR